MTSQELLRYRHEPYRQELIAGRLHEMEPPGAEHGMVAMRIAASLISHVKTADLGIVFASEVGFHLAHDPDTVRAPDVLTAGESLDLVGVVPGWDPCVGEFFA